jgi:ribosomal-protein-alanine N-acetyltransferase
MEHEATSGLLVRPATPDNLDRILQIEQESFTAPWSRKAFEVELSGNPFGRFYVAQVEAEEKKSVVGYVCVWIVFEELRLMNLAVAPPARRRGIGRELLEHALRVGLVQGARRALLEVRASNATALALYERAGFVPKACRARYYSKPVEDAVLMEMDPLLVMDPVANSR